MKPETRNPGGFRLIGLTFLGVVLSVFAVLPAALPLRYTRVTYGRWKFLTSNALGVAFLAGIGLQYQALVHASMSFLIALYREFEEEGFSVFFSSLSSLVITGGFWFSGIYGLAQLKSMSVRGFFMNRLEPFKVQLQEVPWIKEMDFNNLIWFLPSWIAIALMLVLFASLMVSDRAKGHSQMDIRLFRLPDWMIWTFIGSLAASYINHGNPVLILVGKNVLIVTLAAYFFQGVAVLNHFMDRMGIFGFWRMLAWFLAFLQMQVFVCGLGILDFWFDFRLHGILNFRDKSQKRS